MFVIFLYILNIEILFYDLIISAQLVQRFLVFFKAFQKNDVR